MDSHRGRKGKGFASLPCVNWRWQHREVLLYRQSNLAASLHENERDVISSLQMLSTEAEVTKTMLATLVSFTVQPIFPKASTSRPYPNCNGISSASIRQKVASYLLPLELWDNMHVLRVHIQASVRTGQHWSAGSSIGVARGCSGCTCTPREVQKKNSSQFTGKMWKCTPGHEVHPPARARVNF